MVVVNRRTIAGCRITVRHVYADPGFAAQTARPDNLVGGVVQIHVHIGLPGRHGSVVANGPFLVAHNNGASGEGEHTVRAGGNGAPGRAVRIRGHGRQTSDGAASHGEAVDGRHVHRAARFTGGIAGHGTRSHIHAAGVIDRAAHPRAVACESHFGIILVDGHIARRIQRSAQALRSLVVTIGNISDKAAASDGHATLSIYAAAVFGLIATDCAVVHGERSPIIQPDTATHGSRIFLARARAADCASVDSRIGCRADCSAIPVSTVALQPCPGVQGNADAGDAGARVDRAAFRGFAILDGPRNVDGPESVLGIHAAAVCSRAIFNRTAVHHQLGRAHHPDSAAQARFRCRRRAFSNRSILHTGIAQHRTVVDGQPHIIDHLYDAAFAAACPGRLLILARRRLRRIAKAVQYDIFDGQGAPVHNHAAAVKAAVHDGHVTSAVAFSIIVRPLPIVGIGQSRGQDHRLAAVQRGRHILLYGVFRYYHFDAESARGVAVLLRPQIARVHSVKGALQIVVDSLLQLQILARPVVQQFSSAVGNLTHDIQPAVDKAHAGIGSDIAIHALQRVLQQRFSAAVHAHPDAINGRLILGQVLAHRIGYTDGQAVEGDGVAFLQSDGYPPYGYSSVVLRDDRHSSNGDGLAAPQIERILLIRVKDDIFHCSIAFTVCPYGRVNLVKGSGVQLIQLQREGELLGKVACDIAADRVGYGQGPLVPGVVKHHLGFAGGIFFVVSVSGQYAGYAPGGSPLRRNSDAIHLDLCGEVVQLAYLVLRDGERHIEEPACIPGREHRGYGFAGFQREGGRGIASVIRGKCHAGNIAQFRRIRITGQLHGKSEIDVLVRRPVAVHFLGNHEDRVGQPYNLCVRSLATGQGGVDVVDEAMEIGIVVIDKDSELIILSAIIGTEITGWIPGRFVNGIHADFRLGIQAVRLDNLSAFLPQFEVTRRGTVQRVVPYSADALENHLCVLCAKGNTAAIRSGIIPGYTAAVHVHCSIHTYTAAVFRGTIGDAASIRYI